MERVMGRAEGEETAGGQGKVMEIKKEGKGQI